MQFKINDEEIEINIVRKAKKSVRIHFVDSNHLEVSCNPFITLGEIYKILEKNQRSLEKMQNQKRKEEEQNKYFWYLGKKYIPVYNADIKEISFENEFIYAKDQKMLDKFVKQECIRLFQSEMNRILPYFPDIPSFDLKIRNMKTRWGVNNWGSNTITLNSELLKKDLDLLDYVIIHELCHFYEPNHSPNFWRHVEEYYPKYKEARKRLRSVA